MKGSATISPNYESSDEDEEDLDQIVLNQTPGPGTYYNPKAMSSFKASLDIADVHFGST
jgi:hypothetical protein